MDRYVAMQTFCRVVEAGSFAAAAKALDVANSVVTKHVQLLEDWTGSRLLARTTRSMALTEAGRSFYEYCKRTLADTEATLSELQHARGGVSGRLVIAAPVSLTLSYLQEHLHAFREEHPGIQLEVRMSDQRLDLVREGVDIALRSQVWLADSSLVAVPLTTLNRVVCAAPSFWAKNVRPRVPGDLARLDCIVYTLGSDAGEWHFDGAGGGHRVRVSGGFRADNSLLIVDALLRGVGVSLVPRIYVDDHVAAGRLEVVLSDYTTPSPRLHAVYPSRDRLPERVRAFISYLRERLGQQDR
jgi:DNA-binding transcriptional LysR family regulator